MEYYLLYFLNNIIWTFVSRIPHNSIIVIILPIIYFYCELFLIGFQYVQPQKQQTKPEKGSILLFKNINQKGERSTVTKDEIQILGTKPSSNYPFSLFGREIFVPHAGQ